MAFVADLKLVANFYLQSGNRSVSDNFVSFLTDTFDKLECKIISLLRLDSGFHSTEVMDWVEENGICPVLYDFLFSYALK